MSQLNNSQEMVSDFVSLITKGIECWQKAGEIVVKLIDHHGLDAEDIAARSEYLTVAIVGRFEQLGRGLILPQLLVADYPAAKKLIALPYSEQKRAVENPIELLILSDVGAETLNVEIQNLTPDQCRQVFAGDSIRSLSAQRAFIESQKAKERLKTPITAVEEVYRVRGKKVIFTRPCEMSARQLAQIIAQLEQ